MFEILELILAGSQLRGRHLGALKRIVAAEREASVAWQSVRTSRVLRLETTARGKRKEILHSVSLWITLIDLYRELKHFWIPSPENLRTIDPYSYT